MKILFLTSGPQVPSSRFRVLQYVPHLARAGHRCVVATSRPPKYSHYAAIGWRASQRLQRAKRWGDLGRARLGRFDLVVLERELFNDDTTDLEKRFRAASRTLVLDVDDALHLRRPDKFACLAGMCDGVVAGNDFLAEAAARFNNHVSVVPTAVDLDRYPSKKHSASDSGPLVIGWTGSSGNMRFLKIVAEPLRRLAERRDFELRIIADRDEPIAEIDLTGVRTRFVRWNEATEIEDLSAFDIGLMPLDDDPWNHFKCGLKILQYMAIAIPAIASPVGVNPQIISDGQNGCLADRPDAWLAALESLIDDPKRRARLSVAGRKTVEERYSVAVCLPKLVAAWERACSHG